MSTGACNRDVSTAPALPELFERTGKRTGDGREVVKLHQGTDSGGYGGTKTGTCIVMRECDWEAMDLVYEQLQQQFQVEFVPAKDSKVAKKCMPAHRIRVVLRLASRLGGGGAQDAPINLTGCDASREGGGHGSAGSATEAALIIELRRSLQEAQQRAVAAETAVQGLQEQLGAISAEASVLRAEGEALQAELHGIVETMHAAEEEASSMANAAASWKTKARAFQGIRDWGMAKDVLRGEGHRSGIRKGWNDMAPSSRAKLGSGQLWHLFLCISCIVGGAEHMDAATAYMISKYSMEYSSRGVRVGDAAAEHLPSRFRGCASGGVQIRDPRGTEEDDDTEGALV